MKTISIVVCLLIVTFQSQSQLNSPLYGVDTVTSGDCEDSHPTLMHGVFTYASAQPFQFLVFARTTDFGSLICGKKYLTSTFAWDSATSIISATEPDTLQRNPDLTELSLFYADNFYHNCSVVVWERKEGGVWNIYFSRSTDNDSSWSLPEQITNDTVDNTDPQVRPLSDSTAIVFWKRKQALLYATLGMAGVSSPDTMGTSALDSMQYDVTIGGEYNYAVWTSRDSSSKNIMIARQFLTYPSFSLESIDTLFFRQSAFNPKLINSPFYMDVFTLFETNINGSREIFDWMGEPGNYHTVENISNDSLADDENPSAFVNSVITKPNSETKQTLAPYFDLLVFEKHTRQDSFLVFDSYSLWDTVKSAGYNINACVGEPFFSDGENILSVWESNRSGHSHLYGRRVSIYSGDVEKEPSPPSLFELSQNYPNPFNPTTNFRFSTPATDHVSLKIYDVLGREVATVIDQEMAAGSYTYQWNASTFSSGVYFYRLQTSNFQQTRKLVLLK